MSVVKRNLLGSIAGCRIHDSAQLCTRRLNSGKLTTVQLFSSFRLAETPKYVVFITLPLLNALHYIQHTAKRFSASCQNVNRMKERFMQNSMQEFGSDIRILIRVIRFFFSVTFLHVFKDKIVHRIFVSDGRLIKLLVGWLGLRCNRRIIRIITLVNREYLHTDWSLGRNLKLAFFFSLPGFSTSTRNLHRTLLLPHNSFALSRRSCIYFDKPFTHAYISIQFCVNVP